MGEAAHHAAELAADLFAASASSSQLEPEEQPARPRADGPGGGVPNGGGRAEHAAPRSPGGADAAAPSWATRAGTADAGAASAAAPGPPLGSPLGSMIVNPFAAMLGGARRRGASS